MHKYSLLFFLMVAGSGVAQVVSFGVEGGVPLLDRTYNPDESRPYIVGPSVEFRLPARFALRFEAMYQRVGTTAVFSEITGQNLISITNLTSFTNRERANVWEFPLLGKYYFRPRSAPWQPYIETGWALRDAWVHSSGNETSAGSSFSFKQSFRTSLDVGASAGAGVRIPVGRLALSPEVRYTRWGNQNGLLRKNEASILLGVHF